ncbi:MAG TPA: delta-60 repeat domain-containing protein, partial [Usitatibacter sp.]|nr:delta-60 repeat domain-containing protein [Usitatibacter sp.]
PAYPLAYGRKLAVQADGKIVIAGTAFDAANTQSIALMRVLANGAPDAAFGSGGKSTATTAFGVSGIHVALQNNGKIVVGGAINNDLAGTSTTAAAARFTATGTLDTVFGTSGYATVTPPGYDTSNGSEVIYVAGNKILLRVIAERSATTQDAEFLVRLDSGSGAGCH